MAWLLSLCSICLKWTLMLVHVCLCMQYDFNFTCRCARYQPCYVNNVCQNVYGFLHGGKMGLDRLDAKPMRGKTCLAQPRSVMVETPEL